MTNWEKYTDDGIAVVVVVFTLGSYFVEGVSIPTEPMMLVLGYFFGKRAALIGGDNRP